MRRNVAQVITSPLNSELITSLLQIEKTQAQSLGLGDERTSNYLAEQLPLIAIFVL